MRALALAVLAATPAVACEPVLPEMAVDRPIAVAPDGSFVDGSFDDASGFVTGGPWRDIGGGRVGQVIESGQCLDVAQHLIFVDCTRAEAVVVDGADPGREEWGGPGDAYRVWMSTGALQPPRGPLALGPGTTVAGIVALAARSGWRVRTGDEVAQFAAASGPGNAFDPFLGCRLFYPG